MEISSNINSISLAYTNQPPEPILTMGIKGEEQGFPISNVIHKQSMLINRYKANKVNYISSSSVDSTYLSELYGLLVSLGKDEFIDAALGLFDDNIVSVRQVIQGKAVFRVKIKGLDTPVLLSSLGDEIENGIHYTNYEKLWKIVFETAADANCQLFVTTHSKECISAFNRENSNDAGSYFELYKNKKGQIVSKYRDSDQLSYSLSHDGRFRGE